MYLIILWPYVVRRHYPTLYKFPAKSLRTAPNNINAAVQFFCKLGTKLKPFALERFFFPPHICAACQMTDTLFCSHLLFGVRGVEREVPRGGFGSLRRVFKRRRRRRKKRASALTVMDGLSEYWRIRLFALHSDLAPASRSTVRNASRVPVEPDTPILRRADGKGWWMINMYSRWI